MDIVVLHSILHELRSMSPHSRMTGYQCIICLESWLIGHGMNDRKIGDSASIPNQEKTGLLSSGTSPL